LAGAFACRARRNPKDWAAAPEDARSCIPIGSSPFGRWQATRIVPPTLAGAAEPLAPAAALAPPPEEAAGALALLGVPELHAAITAVMELIEKPRTTARLMNWRRVIRPWANCSTTSSCCPPVERRTSSRRR